MYREEAKTLVTDMFTKWKCADGSPAPVIFFGHGLSEDIRNLKSEWNIGILSFENIVYTIQTHYLAHSAKLIETKGAKLQELMTGFDIQPRKLHNAGNDIGYATIVMLLIGLKEKLYPPTEDIGYPSNKQIQNRGLEEIIPEFKEFSTSLPAPTWGIPLYCYRCESTTHAKLACTTNIEPCANCKAAAGTKNKNIRNKAKDHPTERCAMMPYVHYEPLPDWVKKRLSKKQQREFDVAKMKGDVEALGRLVLVAYPEAMRFEDEKEGREKNLGKRMEDELGEDEGDMVENIEDVEDRKEDVEEGV
jgi:hypothetical protein